MKDKSLYIIVALLFSLLVSSCRDDDGSFTNHVFSASDKINTIHIKPEVNTLEEIIQMSIAQLESYPIVATYSADSLLVKEYNEIYYDNAVALKSSYYNIENPNDTIVVGSTLSRGVTISFKNINQLNRDSIYVLPVTMTSANIDILTSARTTYYVFRGASLINVVADIDENYLSLPKWEKPSVVQNMNQVTMEALIRVRDFDKMISTVMGIENYFLIRIGDSGHPSNQIQVATSNGNFPGSNASLGLPTNKWVHIALTYDSKQDGDNMILYVNGVEQGRSRKNLGAVSFDRDGVNGFCIGRSYDDERWLAGEISECRIWNVVRSREDIVQNPYGVDTDSPGLVVYWKFDEGTGSLINDRTGNGNNLMANGPITWNQVKLPE